MTGGSRQSRNVTIKDIAREAGVSCATVSRALAGQSIKSQTRERVLEVCDRMGYMANDVARSMVKRETKLLGILIPSIDNPFMSEMAYHLEKGARENGYSLMLCNSLYDLEEEERAFTRLVGRQVDGILLFPISRESCKNLKKYLDKVPTVFVNENLLDEPESYITADNREGTRIGVDYLYGLGHRRILYFGRQSLSVTHELRARGYEDACAEKDLEPLFWDSDTEETTISEGYEMAKELFAARRDFTAIMAGADTLALGVLQAAEECGIRIPEDISLMGFDNIRYAALPKINLSTIEQPKRAIAAGAIEMLLNKINNEYEAYSHQVLLPNLVRRGSCLPPKGAIRIVGA